MISHTIHKKGNKWYARLYFDGKDGVPKMTKYLNYKDGCWQIALNNDCLFPTKILAESFMKIRLNSESRWSELSQIASHLVLSGEKLDSYRLKDCPQLREMMSDAAKIYGRSLE